MDHLLSSLTPRVVESSLTALEFLGTFFVLFCGGEGMLGHYFILFYYLYAVQATNPSHSPSCEILPLLTAQPPLTPAPLHGFP